MKLRNSIEAIQEKIGDYLGDWLLVITSETVTENGVNFTGFNYFNDGKGNIFWSNDDATGVGKASGSIFLDFVKVWL